MQPHNGTLLKQSDQQSDITLTILPFWSVEMPPLGLAFLATNIQVNGYNCKVIDLNLHFFKQAPMSQREFWVPDPLWMRTRAYFDDFLISHADITKSWVKEAVKILYTAGAKIIGFSVNDTNIYISQIVARALKKFFPETIIIFGGPAVFLEPHKPIVDREAVDYIIVGEGEISLLKLIKKIQNNKRQAVSGVLDCSNNHFVPRITKLSLKNVCLPDYTQFSVKEYTNDWLQLTTSRGCIRNCTFCIDSPMWKPFRTWSPRQIVRQIRMLIKLHGCQKYFFNDSLINGDLETLEELCDLIISENLDIFWSASAIVRPDMDSVILRKMKESGCVALVFGLESGSNRVLKRMGKRFNIEHAATLFRSCRDWGILPLVNVIVGFPGETESDFQQTVHFLKQNANTIHQIQGVSTCFVLPDSALSRNPKSFGITLSPHNGWYKWSDAKGNCYKVRMKRLNRLLLEMKGIRLPVSRIFRISESVDVND